MEIEVMPLSKSEMIRNIEKILLLDQVIVGEEWIKDNFLAELPEKWQFSFQAYAEDLMAGFLVASRKEHAVHIHRLAVGNQHQNMGVGNRLMNALINESRGKNIESITLKVLHSNIKAIEFYKRLGFKLRNRENHNIWMGLSLS